MRVYAEKISRTYFRKRGGANFFYALKETDIELNSCSLIEITGRSGSGKSTLLNALAGLLKPDKGHIWYDDKDIYALNDKERSAFRNENIGMVPQMQSGLNSLTVLENIKLPSLMYGKEVSDDKAMELLEKTGIAQLKDVYPNELSGGEMRRLSIARSLIMEPPVLLADEPTGDLDDENTKMIMKLLRAYADSGNAVLLVTHETDAADYADVIYRMNDGEMVRIAN